jgi:hypothetical protein
MDIFIYQGMLYWGVMSMMSDLPSHDTPAMGWVYYPSRAKKNYDDEHFLQAMACNKRLNF